MVQMGSKTTTIAEADVLRQEVDLLQRPRRDDYDDDDDYDKDAKARRDDRRAEPPDTEQQQIIWSNVVLITALHALVVYALYEYTLSTKIQTILWGESVVARRDLCRITDYNVYNSPIL